MTDLPLLPRDDLYSPDDTYGRSGWRKLAPGETGKLVLVRLPCGHVVTLGKPHQINNYGLVTPSLLCVTKLSNGRKCNRKFEPVTLKGWTA